VWWLGCDESEAEVELKADLAAPSSTQELNQWWNLVTVIRANEVDAELDARRAL
jgi:hypothetical protein